MAENETTAVTLPRLTAVPGGVPDMDADLGRISGLGGAVRVRISPTIYDQNTGQHTTWKGVIWSLELDSFEQAVRFREELDTWLRAWVLTEQVERPVVGYPENRG